MSINVANAPKTSTFQARINPEVKKEVEGILADCGLTLLHSPKAKDILFWGMITSKVLNKTPQIYRFDDFILLTNE